MKRPFSCHEKVRFITGKGTIHAMKRLARLFFPQKFGCFIINLYLCNCYLPNVAMMHAEACGAVGWSTT